MRDEKTFTILILACIRLVPRDIIFPSHPPFRRKHLTQHNAGSENLPNRKPGSLYLLMGIIYFKYSFFPAWDLEVVLNYLKLFEPLEIKTNHLAGVFQFSISMQVSQNHTIYWDPVKQFSLGWITQNSYGSILLAKNWLSDQGIQYYLPFASF